MTLTIREMAYTDLEAADAVLKAAFSGSISRMTDLQLYRQIQPDGWFAAFDEAQLVGTVGATIYDTFAHVGFMAVQPEKQGRGIGRALMEFLLDRLEQYKIPLVTLDASTVGRFLYLKLGFVDDDETLTYQYHHPRLISNLKLDVQPITLNELDELVQKDTATFGADRRKVFQALLQTFPSRAFLQRNNNGQLLGYIIAQKNRIGPWVMLESGRAEGLLQAALALPFEESPMIHLPKVNEEAVNLVTRYGFELVRANKHMLKGPGSTPGVRKQVFAQTSLGVG